MSNFTITVIEENTTVEIRSEGVQGPPGEGGEGGGASVSDTAYDATSWNGVTSTAPSKNAVRDQIETMLTSISGKAATSHTHAISDVTSLQGTIDAKVSDTAYNATSWDAVTTIAPSKNAVRDQVEAMVTSIAGKETSGAAAAAQAYAIQRANHTGTQLASTISDFSATAKSAAVDNTAYDATSWNGVTDQAPSKDAVRDKIEALDAAKANASHTHSTSDVTGFDAAALAASVDNTAYNATTWNAGTKAPSQDAVRDKIVSMDSSISSKADQSSLDAHLNDTTDAHDASAISVSTISGIDATDVQAAIAELKGEIDAIVGGGGTGDVVGPASATDNAIVRFNGTTGKSVQNSGATIDDSGNISANNLSGTNTGDQDLSGLVAKSTYDAHTVLAATTDNTPAALTISEQTVLGRATGGNIAALAIDSDLSSVSSNDDTIPSAKATKAALDGKANSSHTHSTSDVTGFDAAAKAAAVNDTAYNESSWNGVTDVAPSKNAVRDQVETMLTSISGKVDDTAYDATSWNAVTGTAPSKNAVRDQVETMLTSIAAKAPAALVESISFQDAGTGLSASTYVLELYAEYGYTINELKIISGAGTCSAAVKINGTNVTGISAVSVSTTIATGTASAANTVVAGDKVTLVTSSTSSLDNLQATLKTTRT